MPKQLFAEHFSPQNRRNNIMWLSLFGANSLRNDEISFNGRLHAEWVISTKTKQVFMELQIGVAK